LSWRWGIGGKRRRRKGTNEKKVRKEDRRRNKIKINQSGAKAG
jgi:hypothetical protein